MVLLSSFWGQGRDSERGRYVGEKARRSRGDESFLSEKKVVRVRRPVVDTSPKKSVVDYETCGQPIGY